MGDIQSADSRPWLAIGWFTPDYLPLAERFAAHLAERSVPFHLWARPSLGGWDARQKPSVVLAAMDAYPGKTLILMDIDCILRGGIEPMAEIAGDVAVRMIARETQTARVEVFIGSRVMTIRPTAGARRLIEEWQRYCLLPNYRDDENALTWACLATADVQRSQLERRWSGVEEAGSDGECIIVHRSVHHVADRQEGMLWTLTRAAKAITKPFRIRLTAQKLKRIG